MKDFRKWKETVSEGPVALILDGKEMEDALEICGNTVDKEGFIIDKTGEMEEANDSRPIRLDELGAVCPGSKVFIRKNIAAYSHYLATRK